MCDCVEQINTRLEAAGRKDRLMYELTADRSGNEGRALAIYTTKVTKSGNFAQAAPLIVQYCPFCGEKREKEDGHTSDT